jgi:hypothetical protein
MGVCEEFGTERARSYALRGKTSAEHYKHTRPAYYRELVKAGVVETPEESEVPGHAPEPAWGDD